MYVGHHGLGFRRGNRNAAHRQFERQNAKKAPPDP